MLRPLIVALIVAVAAPAAAAPDKVDPHSLLRPEAYSRYDNIASTVAHDGWTCVYVEHATTNTTSGYAYTVGMSGKHLPEVLYITPLKGDVACAMLTAIATRLIRRATAVPEGYEPLPTHKVHLHRIEAKSFFETCTFAGVWAVSHGTLEQAQAVQVVVDSPPSG
ncbi:MAG TPA: DUF4262 domain-containing protein [Candidatus Elarobacter sp.]